MQIGRRIYYDKLTGNVLVDTGERMGNVVESTIEQDFTSYSALSERVPETVGVLQLNFGDYAEEFTQSSSYRINPETQQILFSYSDPAEPELPPVYRPPLTVEIAQLRAQLELVQAALDDLILGGGL